jgi:phospholipase D1/2
MGAETTTAENHEGMHLPEDKRKMALIFAASVAVIVAGVIIAKFVFQDHDAWKETLTAFFETARGTPWALPLVCAFYVFGGAVFFPVTLMNIICAVVFGLWGIVYALTGAMLSVSVYYGLGCLLRKRVGKKLLRYDSVKKVDQKLEKSGLAGVVLVHTLPAPPFIITNFLGGVSSIPFLTFFMGTLFALAPGAIARGVVGDSLSRILTNPTTETYIYFGGGIVLWAILVFAMHKLMKRFQKTEE